MKRATYDPRDVLVRINGHVFRGPLEAIEKLRAEGVTLEPVTPNRKQRRARAAAARRAK
jgi:hypothetical protein